MFWYANITLLLGFVGNHLWVSYREILDSLIEALCWNRPRHLCNKIILLLNDPHPHMDIFQNWGPSDIPGYITLHILVSLFQIFHCVDILNGFFLERNSIKVTWLLRDQQSRHHQMSIIVDSCTHGQSGSISMQNIWNSSTVILITSTIYYFPSNKHISRVKFLNLRLAID